MVSTRARALIWTGAAGALLAASGLVVAEIVARGELEARAASLSESMPGISVAVGDGSALWQLSSGSIGVRLPVAVAALDALVECRSDQDLTVSAVAGGLVVETERTLGGAPVPVQVLLVVRHDGAGWRLVADSVSAAGISLPAERALTMLSGRDGAGAGLADRLLDGIPISLPGVQVDDVQLRAGAAVLSLGLPLARDTGDEGTGAGFAAVRACLGPSASTHPPETPGPTHSPDSSDQEG